MGTLTSLKSNVLNWNLIGRFCRKEVLADLRSERNTQMTFTNTRANISNYQFASQRLFHSYFQMGRPKVKQLHVQIFTTRSFSRAVPEHIDPQLLEQYDELNDFDPEDLVSFFEFMSIYGYNIHQSAQMVIRYPSLIGNYSSTIPKTMDLWRNLGYEEKDAIRILYRHPTLILIGASKLNKRFSLLTEFFSRKEILEGVYNNISLLSNSNEVVQTKMKYLMKRAGHRPDAIAKSKVLSKSLHLILVRHELLIRAGLYKIFDYRKLHKQAHYDNPYVQREKYFSVSDIVCSADKEFLKKCTNNLISLNELVAFDEMLESTNEKDKIMEEYVETQKDEEDDDDDNNSDSDSELETDDPESRRNSSESFCSKKEAQEFYF